MRRDRGWKQKNAAEACDISLRYYQDIEGGSSWPSPEMIHQMAKGFGVAESAFFADPSARDYQVEQAVETLLKAVQASKPKHDRLAHLPDEVIELLARYPANQMKFLKLALETPERAATLAKPTKRGRTGS